jgi:hypothetical protein
MHLMGIASIALVTGLTVFGGAFNQSPPKPRSSAGFVWGRVLDASSGASIGGAIVSLASVGGGQVRDRLLTDAKGRFLFAGLLDGRYSLVILASDYLPSRPIMVVVGAGVAAETVVRLVRPASISGAVQDERGDPIIGARVQLLTRSRSGSGLQWGLRNVGYTDDRGAYRIAGVTPGGYLVEVPSVQVTVPTTALDQRGRVTNDWISAELLAATVSLSGGPLVSSRQVGPVAEIIGPLAGRSELVNGQTMISATTYFPGVSTADAASQIQLLAGEARTGVDLQLHRVVAHSVAGSLTGPDGLTSRIPLRLTPLQGNLAEPTDTAVAVTDSAGQFVFLAVPSGSYVIRYLRLPTVASSDRSSGPARYETLWSHATLAVEAADVTGLQIDIKTGARIAGHIRVSDPAGVPVFAPARTAVRIENVDGTHAFPSETVSPDGAFVTVGMPPGEYLVKASGLPAGWTLGSATRHGQDVAEHSLTVGESDVGDVLVTLTDMGATVHGTVRGKDGSLDADAIVYLFSSDEQFWTNYGQVPRRLKEARTTAGGTFSIGGLPAGEYGVIAVADGSVSDWQNPDVLRELLSHAARIRLADGETASQDLVLKALVR